MGCAVALYYKYTCTYRMSTAEKGDVGNLFITVTSFWCRLNSGLTLSISLYIVMCRPVQLETVEMKLLSLSLS